MSAQPYLFHNYCHDCELSFTSTDPEARHCATCTERRAVLAARLAESTRTVCEVIEVEIEPGFVLKLDEPDWHVFLSRPWTLSRSTRTEKRYLVNPRQTVESLFHRLVTRAPSGMDVDHINGDSLDNRRANLRIVTRSQNAQNVTNARKNSKTGVRGVSWDQGRQRYCANITVNGHHYALGRFDTLDAARDAYTAARRRYHPYAPQEAQ